MNPSIRVLALAVGLAVVAIGCTDQQNAAPGAPAGAAAPAAANVDVSTLKVVQWGPKSTKAGATFNAQPDGNSGMFVELSGDVPLTKFEGTIGGKPLSGVVASGKVVTATIPAEYLATPGTYPVELVVPAQNARIAVGNFTVEGEGVTAPADAAAPATAPTDAAATPATTDPAAAGSTPAADAPAAGTTPPTP